MSNQIEIFNKLTSPFIVKYNESFLHKNTHCIVMEYCSGGDLQAQIEAYKAKKEHFSEEDLMKYLVQVLMAIEVIHSQKIIHRDIKPQNIFLTEDNQVRLGDFGVSKALKDTLDLANTALGTPFFLCPEIIKREKYNSKADIWMVGCTFYEMCNLKKPFYKQDIIGLVTSICNDQPADINKKYSEDLRELIMSMINKNPDERPSVEELLETPFIKKHLESLNIVREPVEYKEDDSYHNMDSMEQNIMDAIKLGQMTSPKVK